MCFTSVDIRFGIIGVTAYRLIKIGDSAVIVAFPILVYKATVVIRLGIIGVVPYSLIKIGDGAVVIKLVGIRTSPVKIRLCKIPACGNGFVKSGYCLVILFLGKQILAPVQVGKGPCRNFHPCDITQRGGYVFQYAIIVMYQRRI
jgi:hypothetical protein